MSHTLKITGVSDEMWEGMDAEIKREHATSRAEFVRTLIRERLFRAKSQRPFYETASPEERSKALHDWVESHDPITPILSDEAMSRESIYGERGL